MLKIFEISKFFEFFKYLKFFKTFKSLESFNISFLLIIYRNNWVYLELSKGKTSKKFNHKLKSNFKISIQSFALVL